MAKRIKEFRHVFYAPVEQRLVCLVIPFNESHAAEVRTVLEPDGINVESAKDLIWRWNDRCSVNSIYLLDIEHS